MFRSVRFYRFKSPWPGSEQELSDALTRAAFTPCAPLTEKSSGWEPPAEGLDGVMCRRVDGADLLRLRTQSRVLPTAAVDEALEERITAYRTRTGELPGRREKRRLKAQTRDELLTRALLKSERTLGFCLVSEGVIGIDTTSQARAEKFLDFLRTPLQRFDAAPLAFKRPVGELITRIFLGDQPERFVLGRECRMLDPHDGKASVRFTDMELADQTVRRHVRDGLRLTHLGLVYDATLSCVLDENAQLSKLKLVGLDEEDAAAHDEPLAELDAQFVLLTQTLRRMLADLGQLLGRAA